MSDQNAWAPFPVAGQVVADLATLKQYVGTRTDQDDDLLQDRLTVATEHVYTRCMQERWGHNDVQEAILLTASRLYKRRMSPEGVAGFGGDGGVVRIIAGDPDINDLMERHLDMRHTGIA